MRIKILLICGLLLSQTLFAAAKIEHWNTSNGTPVYFVKSSSLPMLDVRLVFDAGSARDGKQYGLSALTSAMLENSAGAWNTGEIAQRFEGVGAQFGAGISDDLAFLSLRSLTQADLLDSALETLHAVVTTPRFEADDFKREQQRMLAGLKRREESPGALASIAFHKALYGDHPYAQPSSGFIETVEKFSQQDAKNFYQQYYVTANAMIVLVGDLSKKHAMSIAESLLQGLPRGKKAKALPDVAMPQSTTKKHIEFPSRQTHVLAGVPGLSRNDADYFPLYVGNHILGGSGLVSLLFEEVREKRGLAYSSYSYFSPMSRKGPFKMGLQTRNDQAEQATEVMLATLSQFIADGPTDEQLIAAKKNITGGFAMRFDTNSKLTSYVAMIGFYQKPLDYLENFQGKVEAVTVEQIREAFKRRIELDKLQVVSVGQQTAANEK